jgi:hypothetical protein
LICGIFSPVFYSNAKSLFDCAGRFLEDRNDKVGDIDTGALFCHEYFINCMSVEVEFFKFPLDYFKHELLLARQVCISLDGVKPLQIF